MAIQLNVESVDLEQEDDAAGILVVYIELNPKIWIFQMSDQMSIRKSWPQCWNHKWNPC